jgi:short-subunit dehydrogenase
MLLEGKNAVIYGASGGIGGAMARAFAAEGARVFLTGRTRETLDALAGEIGDAAEVAIFDAPTRRRSTSTPMPSPPRAGCTSRST